MGGVGWHSSTAPLVLPDGPVHDMPGYVGSGQVSGKSTVPVMHDGLACWLARASHRDQTGE